MEWGISPCRDCGHVCHAGCGYLLICEIWTRLPPFVSKGFWRGLTYSLAMQGHCIPERVARNTSKEQRRVADSYNESVQGTDHIYRRLNLVVNLGNEVAVFPNFLFNQNHRSYGRNWSQIKGNSQLGAVVHFMCNIPSDPWEMSWRKHVGDMCRCKFYLLPSTHSACIFLLWKCISMSAAQTCTSLCFIRPYRDYSAFS